MTDLKLSDAIRLGAMLGKQLVGTSRDGDDSCALGAALMAIGIFHRSYGHCAKVFPLVNMDAMHPIQHREMLTLSIIRQLNDQYHWTREQIASWVATVEAAQASAEPPSTNAIDPHAQPQERLVRAGAHS